MTNDLRRRFDKILDLVLGHEPAGEVALPRTGLDPSSKRHFLALIIGTLAIMTFGITVAVVEDGPKSTSATPTAVATPSPIGALPPTAPSLALAC
ncbi:MAG TPA: hypothetical protein VH482_24870 [Thermomicrobiales bacterium]|jgi:hypothetical protein